jgi:predicted amidohydrolase
MTRRGARIGGVIVFAALLARPSFAADDETPLVVSVYQGDCADGDFAANLATVRRVVAEARDRGSHFVCFPECFLSGYDSRAHAEQGARALDDPDVCAFIEESKDHDMVILVGLARRAEDGLYNSMLVIQRGALLGVYDKVFLTGGDRDELGFRPGHAVPVFEAHGTRFAAIICHDSSFPHAAMAARLKGAQLLFSPHYNYIHERSMDDHRRWTRNAHVGLACHFRMVVARSNVIVTDIPHQPGYGDSVILSPKGDPLAEAGLFKTALITATIPRGMLRSTDAWADDRDVPDWLRAELSDALRPGTSPPSR